MWPGPRRLFIIKNDKSNRFSAMPVRRARVARRCDGAPTRWSRRGEGKKRREKVRVVLFKATDVTLHRVRPVDDEDDAVAAVAVAITVAPLSTPICLLYGFTIPIRGGTCCATRNPNKVNREQSRRHYDTYTTRTILSDTPTESGDDLVLLLLRQITSGQLIEEST